MASTGMEVQPARHISQKKRFACQDLNAVVLRDPSAVVLRRGHLIYLEADTALTR